MFWPEVLRDIGIAALGWLATQLWRLVRWQWVYCNKDNWLADLEKRDKTAVALRRLLKTSVPPWEDILARYSEIDDAVLQTIGHARLPNVALYEFRNVLRKPNQHPKTRLRAIIVGRYLAPPEMRIDLRGLYPIGSRDCDTELLRSLDSFEDAHDNGLLTWAAREHNSQQVRQKAVEYLKRREELVTLCRFVTEGDDFLQKTVLELLRGETKVPSGIVDAINSSWSRLTDGARELAVQVLKSGDDLRAEHRKEALLIAGQVLLACENEDIAKPWLNFLVETTDPQAGAALSYLGSRCREEISGVVKDAESEWQRRYRPTAP